MSQNLKDSCQTNLGFPYHGEQNSQTTLNKIIQYLEQQDLSNIVVDNAMAAGLLESRMSALLGTESALWFPSGTLAQGIAARIHSNNKHNRLCLHPTSHLILHEEDGFSKAHDLSAQITGVWREPMNAEGIEDDVDCLFVELPQRHSGGKLPSWEALNTLKQHCRDANIALHMDGARLWSCRPFYQQRSYAEIVAGFDSVYVSLYKDIGAMGGAVLAGSKTFIDQARIWRTRLGGFSLGSWPMIVDSLRLLDERIAQMPALVSKAQELAASIRHLTKITIDPDTPHSNLFHVLLPVSAEVAEAARDKLAKSDGIWLSDRFWGYESADSCAMEIVVGDKALGFSEQDFSQAVTKLIGYL